MDGPNVKLGPFFKFMAYYKLSEILTLIGGGTPKTTNPSYWGGNIPWLSVVDFNNDNRYVHTTEKTITEEGVENSSTKILPQSSLILSARGTVGALAQLAKPMAFNQSCYGIIAKEQTTNDFLYYLLKNVVEDLQAKGHGSVFNTITRDTFDTITVDLPPLDEQKRIAEILGSLDDKIELLQKQNKTLEDMAKALFKSWFVDFDVVRAKAALATRRNLSPLRGKCHNVAKGGPNKPNSSCALVSTHQIYAKSVKNLVRAMRQNLTPQEVKLWQYLRKEQLGVKFRRQFPIDSKYIADFACLEKKLIIELDGTQHAENQHDKERTLYLEDNGFTVLRFWNNEIDKNLIGCLERIRELLNRPPLPAYEENGADNTPLPACGVLSPQGGQSTAWSCESSPHAGEVADKPMGGIKQVENGADNTPLPAYGVLSPQGGQITGEADIMREYHLTDELYDLFPSSFADSPLGPIPSGWEVKPLSKIAVLTMGQSPAGTTYNETGKGLPFYQGRTDFGFRFPKKRIYCSAPTRIAEKGDILISVRAPVGDLNMANETCCIGRGVASIRSNISKDSFLYYAMLSAQTQFDVFNTEGTVFGSINRKDLSSFSILTPIEQLVKEFNNIIGNFDLKIEENLKQIQTLTELRDTLLPRLISGKIEV